MVAESCAATNAGKQQRTDSANDLVNKTRLRFIINDSFRRESRILNASSYTDETGSTFADLVPEPIAKLHKAQNTVKETAVEYYRVARPLNVSLSAFNCGRALSGSVIHFELQVTRVSFTAMIEIVFRLSGGAKMGTVRVDMKPAEAIL